MSTPLKCLTLNWGFCNEPPANDNQYKTFEEFPLKQEVTPEEDFFPIPEKLAEMTGVSEPGEVSEDLINKIPSVKLLHMNMLELITDEPEVTPDFNQLQDKISKEDLKDFATPACVVAPPN